MNNDLGLENIDQQMIPTTMEVINWSSGQADEQIAPSQVHIVFRVEGLPDFIFVTRLKTKAGIEDFIHILEQHRDQVWGK